MTQPRQTIAHIALVVKYYDEAIDFFCHRLGFSLVEDTYQPGQSAFIGKQTGGRVFLFLRTDDFWRDYNNMVSVGIRFVRPPRSESYGTVAVFEDLYGNLWDLIGPNQTQPVVQSASRNKEGQERCNDHIGYGNGDPCLAAVRRVGLLEDADHRLLAVWAAACAESVLHFKEGEFATCVTPLKI